MSLSDASATISQVSRKISDIVWMNEFPFKKNNTRQYLDFPGIVQPSTEIMKISISCSPAWKYGLMWGWCSHTGCFIWKPLLHFLLTHTFLSVISSSFRSVSFLPSLLREPVCRWWSWPSCQSAPCAWRGWMSQLMASSPPSATTAFTASVSSGGKMPRELWTRHTHTHITTLYCVSCMMLHVTSCKTPGSPTVSYLELI